MYKSRENEKSISIKTVNNFISIVEKPQKINLAIERNDGLRCPNGSFIGFDLKF